MDNLLGNALNAGIGISTVFAVLLLVMGSIYLLNLLRDKRQQTTREGESTTVVEEASNQVDDLALVAVITAAIVAYEGNITSDDFIVKTIKKAKRL